MAQPSPAVAAKSSLWLSDSVHVSRFIVYTRDSLPSLPLSQTFKLVSRGNGIYLVSATPSDMTNWLKKIRGYAFWDQQVDPVTEAGVINYDMTLNGVSAVWNRYPQLDGKGQTVSVKEGRPDTNDIDLSGRHRNLSLASTVQDNHATIMTTLIVGAGNSSFRGKGVAYSAGYSSSDFTLVLPDSVGYYRYDQIHIQNHSYGTGIQNFYGVNARAFDQSALDDTTLLHIISAGNSGTAASSIGTYAGLTGFANITGNFKQAKNILLAGAQVADGTVPAFSSRGPLYDGRIAPHLVAFGDDGTSGAAAMLSGTSLLIHQEFKQRYGRPMGNALLKAILINTARDLGAEGPDYTTGYGSLDANAALESVVKGTFHQGTVRLGERVEWDLLTEGDEQTLKLTLVWNDLPAEPGIDQSLRNDLDLELVHVQTGQTYHPWTLLAIPSADSLRSAAKRERDTLNNIEQVSIKLPVAGLYKLRVHYPNGVSSTQAFSVAYQVSTATRFRWDFPLAGDQWVSGEEQWLRWSTDDTISNGRIELSTDEGQTWREVAVQVGLHAKQFKVVLPDTMRSVKFRMKVDQLVFETSDNIVSPSRALKVGLVCDTAVLLYWNNMDGAQKYVIYRLENSQMVQAGFTSDTSILLNAGKGKVFAVAGKFRGTEGVRGVAVDYRNQQAGCYISRFLAGPGVQNGASMVLDLGTQYSVAGVEIVKRSDRDRVILSQKPLTGLSYRADDPALHQGKNIYQAIVTLADGSRIFSDEQVVYFLGNKNHVLYPNPVSKGQPIYLLSELSDDLQAEIIDLNGKVVQRFVLKENVQMIPTAPLPGGMYVLRVHEADGSVQRFSFIIH